MSDRAIQLNLWDRLPGAGEERVRTPSGEVPTPHPGPRDQAGGPEVAAGSAQPRPWFGYFRSGTGETRPRTYNSEGASATFFYPDPRIAAATLAFERAFRRMFMRRPVPQFNVEFRRFAGLHAAIRLRPDRAEVRMSDFLTDAGPLVTEALAEILLARLFRCRASREARECYMAWSMSPATRSRVDEARRARGRKRLLPAQGRYFDLQPIFERLNQHFFQGQLAVARIGWSLGRSRTRLGHHDPAHRTITVSRWFDSESVPRYLVEYLVYHEMLHIHYPAQHNGGRRVVHSRAFREAEKNFPHYEEACKQLKKMSSEEVW